MTDYTKCTITRFPEPVLSKPARPIEKIDESIRQLAERMKDLMVEYQGVGLAGPQAGVNLQIFVASPNGTKEDAKVYINPIIEPEGELQVMEEGCLSLPNIWGKITRYYRCTVKAIDLDGKSFTEIGEGMLARIFQHEYDHLQGMMIKDRMTEPAKLRARKTLKRMQEEYEQKTQQ
jgi:peptide deformylase